MSEKLKTTSKQVKAKKNSGNIISWIAPILCVILGYSLWRYGLGADSGFSKPDLTGGFWPNHKGPRGLHAMYEGGIIVPMLISLFLIILTFVIERLFTINKALGRGSVSEFIVKVKHHLNNRDIESALKECDRHKGSVGNVMKSGLIVYQKMTVSKEFNSEQKILAIQKEIEEATALEMPLLERNLVFLSTIASVATLVGLLGTVIGMIRSFKSLGEAGGAGAAAELAQGIAEALYNTALGIGTSAVAIIMYNIFTTKIDGLTFGINESGFTLTQSFATMYE